MAVMMAASTRCHKFRAVKVGEQFRDPRAYGGGVRVGARVGEGRRRRR
jgi:hypothetical protein